LKVAKKHSRRDYALLLIAYRHGLRASEVGLLRKEDLDFKTNRIRVSRLKHSMGGDQHLEPDEAQALRSYLRTRKDSLPYLFLSRKRRPISRYALDDLMKRYGALARIPADRRHFHVLKHSIAMHLTAGETSVMALRQWLGHKNIQNTMVYAQLRSPQVEREVRRARQSGEVV
ncbi:MAG: tyrosine-type recombinase/integrase, partial [Planctomycetota bacterium]